MPFKKRNSKKNQLQVRRGITDIGIGHVGVVWPRAQIIDYTHYTYFLEVGHKTRKPIPKNPIFNIFLPYTNGVWIAITVTIIVTCCVFAILGKFNRFYAKSFKWHDFIIMPTSMLMECGIIETAFYRKIQRTKAGFIMVGTWVIVVFFLVKAYESNLLASILAKVYEDPIDSFQGKPIDYILRDNIKLSNFQIC